MWHGISFYLSASMFGNKSSMIDVYFSHLFKYKDNYQWYGITLSGVI